MAQLRHHLIASDATQTPRFSMIASNLIPKVRKGKAARKAEVDAFVAEDPKYLEDLIEKCSSESTDDQLRDVVETIQTRDLGRQSTLVKLLTKKTSTKKSDLLALTKTTPENVATTNDDYSDAEWPTHLQRGRQGVLSTFTNAITVVAHDPRWKDRLAWCEFTSRIVLRANPPWSTESSGRDPESARVLRRLGYMSPASMAGVL